MAQLIRKKISISLETDVRIFIGFWDFDVSKSKLTHWRLENQEVQHWIKGYCFVFCQTGVLLLNHPVTFKIGNMLSFP